MPRKARPGGNRTDLYAAQPAKVPTGLPYGEASQLQRSQQAAPLPAGLDQQALEAAQATTPPPPITAPSDRPEEPLTAGLTSGPGAGPEILGTQPGMSPLDQLRGLYGAHPAPEIAAIIAYAESRGEQ